MEVLTWACVEHEHAERKGRKNLVSCVCDFGKKAHIGGGEGSRSQAPAPGPLALLKAAAAWRSWAAASARRE